MPGGDADAHVTQTRALGREFCLSAKDLCGIPHELVPNPHYRSGAPMKLFRAGDLWAAALAKHGSRRGVRLAAEKRAAAAAKRAHTMAESAERREHQLTLALDRIGLSTRGDSFLCKTFVARGPTREWSLEAVVERMAQMKFLHEYTDFRRTLGAIRNAYKAEGAWWDARETEREAEHVVLRKRRGWPSPWPWLPTHWSRQTHAQSENGISDPGS